MKNFLEKIKQKKEIIIEIIILIVISIFSFSLAPKTLQNDTYYTVSIGNLILENGIDGQDHFSWHENLPYTYPHWLYDVIMSLIYNFGEFCVDEGILSNEWDTIYISVCILSIVLGITIYEVNKKLNKNRGISFLITLGAMYLLESYIAARAQLVTFILFMIAIYFIEKFLENRKIKYGIGIIAISILIANLHVAVWPFLFILSLPYIAEYIICVIGDIVIFDKIKILYNKIKLSRKKQKLKKNKANTEILKKQIEEITLKLEEFEELNKKRKNAREQDEPYKIRIKRNKNVKWLILIMLICAISGLLTPLGTTPYTYLLKTMQGNTTSNINEHLPLTLIQNVPIMCTIIIVIAIITFTKVKIRLSDLFMLGGLTYLMFASKRQSTMFVLIGSIILNRVVTETIKIYGVEKFKVFITQLIEIGTAIVTCVVLVVGINNIIEKSDDAYVSKSTYPIDAATWILENLDVQNIKLFNEYNYGSYLLYRGIPVFIDSRADLYSPEFNTTTGNSEDGQDIFMDFINTSGISTYYGSTFEKYGITHVILYKNSKISMLIDETEPEKYDKIYSDKYFVIYEVIQENVTG